MTIFLVMLLLVLGIIPILLMQQRLNCGRTLLHGGRDLIGFDDWCKRHLGIWWADRAAIVTSFALFCLFANSSALMPISVFGLFAGQHVAHALGLNWPGKEQTRAAYERIKQLQRDPGYRRLQERNENLEVAFVFLFFSGLILPFLFSTWFKLYNRYDWHQLWILGLGLGLTVTLPTFGIAVWTLPKGWWRFIEFFAYLEMKHPGNIRGWRWCLAIFIPLTVISAVMIARTAGYSG